MNRRFLVIVCLITSAATTAWTQQTEWKDSSPHTTRFIAVEDGVQLEVLDWGGPLPQGPGQAAQTGPPIVLLAGLGGTAHHFDDIAPLLGRRHRVIAVTRRGHRGSSPAASGYGFARLAEDVVRVLDAVGIDRPVIVGHSFAGEELHVLGARYSTRIRGLVYVDAAFDRGDDADNDAFKGLPQTVPAAPRPAAGDLASFTTLRAYLDRYGGAGPEGYLRTRYRANPDGSVAGLWAPDLPIRQAMTTAMQTAYKPYRPERVRVPPVAIYAVPKSAEDLMRRGSSDRLPVPELVAQTSADPALRERIEQLYLLTRQRVTNHEKWFQAFADGSRVVELSGQHDLVVSNPRELLDQIESFVRTLR